MTSHAALAILSVAAAFATACSPSDSAHAAKAPATPAAAGVGAAAGAMPHDSITDRADAGRIEGSASAPVWLIEASDFQCPFCKNFHDETYPQIVRDYVSTGKVRLAYLNFPLEMHPHAAQAAEAAMCASVQNKFWPMHDSLFITQPRWAERTDALPVFDSLAVEVGVNAAQWRRCMQTHATQPLIAADRQRSASNGVRSTPSFFVMVPAAGGTSTPVVGAQPYATFKAAIDKALESAAAGKSQHR